MNAIAPILLVVSLALSQSGFVAIFDMASSVRNATTPSSILACTVCITAFGLAFSVGPWSAGVMIVAAGFLLGQFARGIGTPLAALMSFACLLAYLKYGAPSLQ